jgi:FtsZ-binding cell division protein ZapB
MNRIVELADAYAAHSACDGVVNEARAALATEVQAQQDYTRAVIAERDELMGDVARLVNYYDEACHLVAKMHQAAVGDIKGPNQGVVEDVENLRKERDALKLENERLRATSDAWCAAEQKL